MGAEFTFYDYIDENGINVVREWLHGEGVKVTADFNAKIMHLEATKKGLWSRPTFDDLKDDCDGLFELRGQTGKIKLRLLGFFHPSQEKDATLVLGFRKTGKLARKYPCAEAFRLRDQVLAGAKRHRVIHDIEPPRSDSEES